MTIRYEFEDKPDIGNTMPITQGLHWLRMPLPFSLGHINLWLLEDDNGWAVVDTGIHTDHSKEVWNQTIGALMGDKSINHVVVTHLHPDHVGCAGWLTDEYDIDLWMTREEYLLCRVLVADTGRAAPEEGVNFYHAAGFPAEALHNYQKMFGMFGKYVAPLPEAYQRLQEGDRLDFAGHTWEVLVGRGHSVEHACFFDAERKLFISGDQLLPTISSNVSVYPTEPGANPLKDWLGSLRMLKATLPDDVLVLPAHGKPFRGAHGRLDELVQEHLDGCDALLEHCKEPKRALDTFAALFKSRISDSNLIMATGESVAHLNYLIAEGEIAVETDTDGINWYRRA
ncbi:MAG: MBL fold metallo-hydrolase [Woeseiaceae bacterium]|nr:MBL fold metallo-hydrolase [Woeseiaceae bacterium]NIP19534.1 MBL fold metallo-hydrolase [Woeseiaceae bacterium]NIS88489.1 MBL fold metallo-hydrolase [Woeseiaceae bacterium]